MIFKRKPFLPLQQFELLQDKLLLFLVIEPKHNTLSQQQFMYTSQELRSKYRQLLNETERIPERTAELVSSLQTNLREGLAQANEFDRLYLEQVSTLSKVIEVQQMKLTLQVKQDKQASDWNYLRAKHIALEKERMKQLKKTLEVLEAADKRVETDLRQFQDQNQKQGMAEVQYKVHQANQQKITRSKFANITNKSKRKGVESNLQHGIIQVIVEKRRPQDLNLKEMVQYQVKWHGQQGRFVPGKDYSPAAMKAIIDYNFHKDLRQLEQDLTTVTCRI